jgi:cysteine desulfurase
MTQQPLTVCGSKNIYLDHNATTPTNAEISNSIGDWSKIWGNPSSIHWNGREPKALIRDSRKQIANLINVNPIEIVFTSSGSEANNHALCGALLDLIKKKPNRKKVITTTVEHPSVSKTLNFLEDLLNLNIIKIPVNKKGELDLKFFKSVLDQEVALVTVMSANNETGSCFPIQELCLESQKIGALFHTDAVQTLGKMPIDLKLLGVDLASFSAHKFYANRGCGFLYVKSGTPLESFIHGGSQERGRRAGTENLMGILSAAKMAKYKEEIPFQCDKMSSLRDHLESSILKSINGTEIIGGSVDRLPNTSCITFHGVNGESLLMSLDIEGFSVSSGAACSSGNPEPSPILMAMGLSHQEAQSSLRVSIGWTTTKMELDKFVTTLIKVVKRLREVSQ